MPKVFVDPDLCTGCGNCEEACPEVFRVEDDGVAHVIGEECGTCDLQEVADNCPSEAITISE